MRALTLQPVNVAPGEQRQQQATCGRSLCSNYAPLSLENKILAQTSLQMSKPSSCASLQPSSLSCTSSSLLSCSSLLPSITSSLLSTENRLLTSDSPRFSFSLTSSIPADSLLPTSLPSGALLNRLAQPPSFLHAGPGEQQKSDVGGDVGREEISEEMQASFDGISVESEEDDGRSEEEEEEDYVCSTLELPSLETDSVSKETEPAAITQEEFPVFDRGNEKFEEELKDKKYLLLNAVCCSLVSKNTPPGQDTWDAEDSVWTNITNLAKDISVHDPEFLLKVAVYARQELNIRITANFLLALAANQPSTKPHVRRYFCAAVQLPSDWLEIVRIYSTCFSHSLPMCLKKAMADKFKQFSEYQLAKYNTRKHRCKRSPKSRKGKKPTEAQLKQWADTLRSEPSILKKFLTTDKKVVDKKQSEFTMKKMIKRLHIKGPAKHIMAILGKKYPADLKAFNHSGMEGVWERERAGQRMKLKEPETWERLVSAEGNKAATWEKLLDNNSLPFMAMLRNLRNMITQSISEAHHKKVLSRLSNKKAVIQSRQFPFRFLAAYKVIMELQALASTAQQAVPSAQEILKGILKKFPKCKRTRRLDWETTKKKRVKMTLRVPFVYQKYRLKKAQLLKANQRQFTVALLQRYCKALETAVQISCRYNVPPLPGRTAVILFTDLPTTRNWDQKQDFCLPPASEEKGKEEDDKEDDDDDEEWEDADEEDEEDEEEDDEEEDEDKEEEEEEEEDASSLRRRNKKKEENEDKLSPSMMEAAMLLSLMICSSAEDGQLHLVDNGHGEEAKLKSDVLLENVRSGMAQLKSFDKVPYEERAQDYLDKVFTKTNKIDNIIVVVEHSHKAVNHMINNYSKDVNSQPLVVEIVLSGYVRPSTARNHVVLQGFSEQILRFVAERGSTRLMDHVDHLDKLYNVPPPEGAKDPQNANSVVSIPVSPKLRWRGVRVFISSTFRDMHAERDILVWSVFPELRRRAASHCLYLQEVELRWGVTEEESCRATELCLSEVCRSQMMVGVLGERYGLVPPKPVLPDLPQHSWLASAPEGLSITEMEIRQFQALFPDSVNQRMFCYFRDPNITKSVPAAWRSDFAPESKEAESKMASLKSSIRASDIKVTENYPCEWGGVVEGKPYLRNLEDFGKAVLDDLWTAVVKQFVEEDEEAEAASDVSEQEVHQEALQRQFFGRAKLLSRAVEVVEQVQSKGGLMVVDGGPGEGKTVFMAALADALRTRDKSKSNLVCDVISYSTAASQSARSVQNLLRCLVQWFRKIRNTEKKSPLPHSYKDLLSEFHSALSDVKRNKPLVLMVDGMDGVQDGGGQLNSNWIPQQLPQGVCLIVSITPKADLLQTLVKRRSTVPFTLGQLTMPDRREIIQRGLEAFGKKLSDTAFNNQLQNLIMKKGAMSPLFLHLACEDLRNFASFDQLKKTLQDLPESLSQLVQHNLNRLCSQHRGMLGLRWTLAVLTVSPTGLRERDLYSVLNTCNHLSSQDRPVSWQDVLQLSWTPKGRVPMATFTSLVQSLRSLIGSSHCHNTDDLLSLTNPEVRQSFEDFLLPAESDRTRAHLVLAAHLWTLADPQETNTFLHCEANSLMHLPSNLIESGQLEALGSLLSSYYFLYACVRHGLLHHLLETYSLYDKKEKSAPSSGVLDHLEDCWSFLRRHASLLSSCPPLFIQQAFNEPPETSAHIWAQGMVGKGGIRVVECLNNKDQIDQDTSELVSSFSSDPTCLDVSPDGELMVVGTGQGTLHFINAQTGQKVKSLVSSCDGISSCVFLKDGHLATTSFDGRIEIWEIQTGCRTALIKGHVNVITASDISADHRHLATVSLDFMLKVWSATQCHEVAVLTSPSPMNCVTFDPEARLLAAGCWDGKVIVWNWLQNETQTSLCGHQRSVRSVSFSSSSSMLCSGSISGEVRVWSVPTSTCVGCFQAHHGATEVLTFLDEGAMLLTGGSDHMLQLWSGGLGRSVAALKSDNCDLEPPQKKLKTVNSVSAALCVAVNGDYAAVGYHGEGIKLFSLDSGKMIWSSRDLDVSILCLLWVALDAEQTKAELLVSGGSDKHLRVWRREEGEEGTFRSLGIVGTLGVQPGDILALAQNSTYLATASDNFTIALWLLSDLSVGSHVEPHVLLRGHRGGVTCLAFSPDGGQLLSGGKDTALMVWDMNPSPPVLSKSLPHSHRDWITGCVWTPDCVISSSNDGRLCLWDLKTGKQLREISWSSALTSVCCLGQYVIAGCAEGALHVWSWETNVEIGHISAHKQRIHHCSLLTDTDKNKEVNPEEMTVLTASDDGTVQLWKPLQMEHFNSFLGHSGTIHGVVRKRGVPEFLTVSEDCSLRSWTWTTKSPLRHSDPITALCFSQSADLCLAGYTSGLLEMWQHNAVVCRKQASDSSVTAICSLSDGQFAVGSLKKVVDVWKLVWNQQHDSGSLVKVTTYTVPYPLVSLFFCSSLIGVSSSGFIFDITNNRADIWSWFNRVRFLGVNRNSEMSVWLAGEEKGEVRIGFIFSMGPKTELSSAFNSMKSRLEQQQEEDMERKEKRASPSAVSAVTMDREFIVCGDMSGNMWFNQTSEVSIWTSRKPAHDDRISVLRLTESTIISASYDKTVKLWDRTTEKQVGMFVCGGPVLALEVNPEKPTELVCADGQGKLYFLSWKE
ncbi:telomerase protein component 1 isoform X3 [Pleuronectes platessa]|uniref:telomerase protein component 1 isoform X3 n=1 Tax=Pleuronectes platessa TaxID=8262 RepID=UPI00232A163C|nr:telomerase protein component 1 isoform X3 [Pleuronectes platessa]